MTDWPAVPGEPDEPDAARGPETVDLVAAALRADAADVDALVQFLMTSLGDILPAELVEVERERSLGDWLSGRPACPVAVTVTTPEAWLRLSRPRSGEAVRAEVRRIVREVVISRRDVSVDEWIDALARVLSDLATQNSRARQALTRLLQG